MRTTIIIVLFLAAAATVFGQGDISDKEFPAHKIIGNTYFVGSDTHSSFLITTPQGHILVNTMYERTVPWIRKSVETLGFKFEDIKIILGSHAHVDHMARMGKGSNPFVDPQGYFAGIDKYERQFQQALEAQRKAARSNP
jgi:metallo-beta-lactamase class B